MSEPTKENPKTPKRSKRKPAMEPLGWDEIVSQPGMGGYLSFLNGPVPLPHLQTPEAQPDPGVASGPGSQRTPESVATVSTPVLDKTPDPVAASVPGISPASVSSPALVTGPVVEADPALPPISVLAIVPEPVAEPDIAAAPVVVLDPALNTASAPDSRPVSVSTPIVIKQTTSGVDTDSGIRSTRIPGVVSGPAIPSVSVVGQTSGGRIRIRKCASAQDGHSLGEEVLYQALWKAASPEPGETRTITIGWRGMSQLCRMTPKNCKINTQRLLRKLALEVLSPYNTPESIGTTYRVYSAAAIVQRRRAGGLEWVVRSRGVEFVDPATGLTRIAHLCDYVASDSSSV